jgi:uncharacterized membrane protein
LGVVATTYKSYSYYLADFLLVDTGCGAVEAVKRSKELMRGRIWSLFVLRLSFIGWWLWEILTLGIGSYFIAPYIQATETAFFLDVTERVEVVPAPSDEKPRSEEFQPFRL